MEGSSLLKLFNEFGTLTLKDFKKLSDLDTKAKHKVIRFEKIRTKFGPATIAEFQDSKLMLPGRLNKVLTEGNISKLNALENKFIVIKGFTELKGNMSPNLELVIE